MKRVLITALLLVPSITAYAGSYFPKAIQLVVPESIEIYSLDINCWVHDYEPFNKELSVWLGFSTDPTIETGDPCHGWTSDPLSTSCEEDLTSFEEILSGFHMCDYSKRLNDHGGSIDIVCKSTRKSVVDLLYDACSLMRAIE